jgi:hypothetical protein
VHTASVCCVHGGRVHVVNIRCRRVDLHLGDVAPAPCAAEAVKTK